MSGYKNLKAGEDCPQCSKGMMKNAGYEVKGGKEYPVLICSHCSWKVRPE